MADATTLDAAPKSGEGSAYYKLRQHLDSRLIGMRVERYSWWTHWRELADYLLPRRYKWLVTPNQAARGSPLNQRIIDSTPTLALRVLASGMMSGITSPGRPWFRLTLEDTDLADNPDVKLWLEEVYKRMARVFAESNFYNAVAIMYGDLGCFGTAVMIIDEDFDDVIRCYTAAAGEYYLANGKRMDAEVLFREFVMTVKQVADKFGLENCSPSIQQAISTGGGSLTREIIVGHAIEPNPDYQEGKIGYKGMRYREIYWEIGQDQTRVLSIKGRAERPFMAPRWDIVSNDPYGRSPGMDALGDIKMLQVEQKRKAQAIDKHVNPPMVADVSMRNQPATLIPGGVTYITSTPNGVGFKPVYEVAPDISGLVEDIREVQERVKTTFFNDLFMMISQLDTVRTATEIDARKEEKLIQLGPVLERFESEFLDPAIERTFAIMVRARIIPPAPPVLRGQHIKVEYISMLAEAQKAVATAGIERLAQFVGNLAAAVPDALDNVDWDEMIDEYADKLGVSPKIIRSLRKIMEIRKQKAAQQQAMQQAQSSMAAVQGAQVLSNTDVGGGQNALQKMLGQ